MNTGNSIKALLIALMVLAESSNAVFVNQMDWSGGPGVSGPVTSWSNTFDNQHQMGWYPIPPGKLFLGISSTQHVISSTLEGPDFAFPADMDGDGDMDAVSSSPLSPTYRVAWFENDGTGGGWNMHVISENYAVIECAYPADIDCDGDIDVLGTNSAMSKTRIEWWRNEDGVGDSWKRFVIGEYFFSLFICASDINGNDTLNVVAPGWSADAIYWWESLTWPPDSSWWGHQITGNSDDGRELFPADFNQDGHVDIVVACEDHNGLKWFENPDEIGVPWVEHNLSLGYPYSVHASDMDGDSDYDVIYCSSGHEKAAWCENLDGFGANWEYHLIQDDLVNAHGIHSADVTDDGYTDVIVALGMGSSSKRIYLYRNMDGTGSEWLRFQIASGSWFEDVDVADFDQDGSTDVLSAGLGASVAWHELEGNTDGWLLSSILDLNTYPQWDSVTWVADEPSGTDVFFNVRSSNDWQDMGAWSDTLFEPQSLVGVIDSTHRYIQYRVGMTSDTEFETPYLDEVRFYWTYMGIEGDESITDFSVSAFPNPASGSVNISIPAPFIGSTEILIYDLLGKLVRRFSELESNVIQWDCDDESGCEVPSGLYFVQAMSGDHSQTVRFVRL